LKGNTPATVFIVVFSAARWSSACHDCQGLWLWGAVVAIQIAAHDPDQSRYCKASSSDLTITPLRIDTDTTNNPK